MDSKPVVPAATGLDRSESFLWTIIRRFESLALEQYTQTVPALATPQKRALVARLDAQPLAADVFDETQLAAPLQTLVDSAVSANAAHVLVVQGLLLELLGATIYTTFGANSTASELTRDLCAQGGATSAVTAALVPDLVRTTIGNGDVLLQAFMNEAGETLRCLDSLGEGIDELFESRFSVSFADLMGDVAAELIATAIDLGVDRRKFVAYLTGALMGI